MKVYIVCRAFIDWRRQSDLRTTPNKSTGIRAKGFRRMFDLWNKTFSISYFDCRQKIHELARVNWESVKNVTSIYVKRGELYRNIKENDLVLPIDDDDWYQSDIVAAIESRIGNDLYLVGWNEVRLVAKKTGPSCWMNQCASNPTRLFTNAYGIIWHDNIKARQRRWIINHSRASWSANRNRSKYLPIDKFLCCNNKHMLSLNRMNKRRKIGSSGLIDMLVSNTKSVTPLEEAKWTTPYISGMRDIYKEVLESRKA